MAKARSKRKKSARSDSRSRAPTVSGVSQTEKPAQPAPIADSAPADVRQFETPHAHAREDGDRRSVGGVVFEEAPPVHDGLGPNDPLPTDAEARILAVLADPDMARASVEKKAAAAGMSRATWYRVTATDGFEERTTKFYRRALRTATVSAMEALTAAACDPDPKGASDRKLFFTLVGMMPEPGASKSTEPEKAAFEYSDEQLMQVYVDRGLPIPPGVRRRLEAAGKLPPEAVAA
jgi:hypothetical protein